MKVNWLTIRKDEVTGWFDFDEDTYADKLATLKETAFEEVVEADATDEEYDLKKRIKKWQAQWLLTHKAFQEASKSNNL